MTHVVSPEIVLARMAFSGLTPAEIAAQVPAGSELAMLLRRHRAGIEALCAMLRDSGVDHAQSSVEMIRQSFERAVRCAPEASVAAYCLGDAGLLGRATDELVAWLRASALIGAETDVLDVGCGIGRVAAAIAPFVGSVVGIDVADAMVDEARRRAVFPNVRFLRTDGEALPVLPESVDLVLFVDSMPYLVQAGVADRQVEQSADALRSGGALLVLNLAYAGDDHKIARAWSERHGLVMKVCGERPFRIWDGKDYLFVKDGRARPR